jgi:coenzyme F420-0:L-glutamate ligase/coenzyme F420-1:gamma-L-glutamate ligase
MSQITLTALPDIPMIEKGDHLSEIILHSLKKEQIILQNGDILVLAQKIVSSRQARALWNWLRKLKKTRAWSR